jgi:hypothetical protein
MFVVTLCRRDAGASRGRVRADVFALLGTVAESATFVRQVAAGATLTFDVCTGILAGDGPFAPHGHLLRIVVAPTSAESSDGEPS